MKAFVKIINTPNAARKKPWLGFQGTPVGRLMVNLMKVQQGIIILSSMTAEYKHEQSGSLTERSK